MPIKPAAIVKIGNVMIEHLIEQSQQAFNFRANDCKTLDRRPVGFDVD